MEDHIFTPATSSRDALASVDADPIWRLVSPLERLGALLLLIALSPLLFIVATVVVSLSRQSPLIGHRRVGRGHAPIWVYKFRSMWSEPADHSLCFLEFVPDEIGPAAKAPADGRVTSPVGRLLRRYSLDEFPQLWNVVLGEMSLVGARPITELELQNHYGNDADEVLSLNPGITGVWQVNGRNRLTYAQRRQLDVYWTRNRSLSLYCQILLKTIGKVLSGADAW